jgi:hypothetical protein
MRPRRPRRQTQVAGEGRVAGGALAEVLREPGGPQGRPADVQRADGRLAVDVRVASHGGHQLGERGLGGGGVGNAVACRASRMWKPVDDIGVTCPRCASGRAVIPSRRSDGSRTAPTVEVDDAQAHPEWDAWLAAAPGGDHLQASGWGYVSRRTRDGGRRDSCCVAPAKRLRVVGGAGLGVRGRGPRLGCGGLAPTRQDEAKICSRSPRADLAHRASAPPGTRTPNPLVKRRRLGVIARHTA